MSSDSSSGSSSFWLFIMLLATCNACDKSEKADHKAERAESATERIEVKVDSLNAKMARLDSIIKSNAGQDQ